MSIKLTSVIIIGASTLLATDVWCSLKKASSGSEVSIFLSQREAYRLGWPSAFGCSGMRHTKHDASQQQNMEEKSGNAGTNQTVNL